MERYLIGGDAEKFLWVSVMTRIYENGARQKYYLGGPFEKIYEIMDALYLEGCKQAKALNYFRHINYTIAQCSILFLFLFLLFSFHKM